MAARRGAVHVATTKRVYKGKTYVTHLLRRSIRRGKTVTHETLGNLSHLPDHLIEISDSRSPECHSSYFADFDSDSLNRHHPDLEQDWKYGLQEPEPARFRRSAAFFES